MSNIFNAIASREHANDSKLGTPSTSLEHFVRRKTLMEQLAGGKGWRTPAKEVRKFADGTTRGQRKRLARERANAKVSEERPVQYRHRQSLHLAELRAAA